MASFSFLSFFLLQRSLSSHGSSHLFTITCKFCYRAKGLLITLLDVMQFYNTHSVVFVDHAEFIVTASQNTVSTSNFSFRIAKNQTNLDFFKYYIGFLYNIFWKTYLILLLRHQKYIAMFILSSWKSKRQ